MLLRIFCLLMAMPSAMLRHYATATYADDFRRDMMAIAYA